MVGREFVGDTVGGYRFGFNGKEKTDEIYGDGNGVDFGARIYDGRLGRWLSVDPLQAKYQDLSPYNFVSNNPIIFIDPGGKRIDLNQLSKPEKRQYKVMIRQLKKSEVFKEIYKQLKQSESVVVVKFDNNSIEGFYEESTEGDKLTRTATIGAFSKYNALQSTAQELFGAYQRIEENADLYKDYQTGDYEAEGEVATFFIMKQAGKDYTPLGSWKGAKVVDGKNRMDLSNVFDEHNPTKEDIKSEEFNNDYQSYKEDLNDHFKSRQILNGGDGAYSNKIDKFGDSKANGMEKLTGGTEKKKGSN